MPYSIVIKVEDFLVAKLFALRYGYHVHPVPVVPDVIAGLFGLKNGAVGWDIIYVSPQIVFHRQGVWLSSCVPLHSHSSKVWEHLICFSNTLEAQTKPHNNKYLASVAPAPTFLHRHFD